MSEKIMCFDCKKIELEREGLCLWCGQKRIKALMLQDEFNALTIQQREEALAYVKSKG